MAWAMYLCLKSSSKVEKQDEPNFLNFLLTSAPGIVAAIGIYLGVILPEYYNRFGITIPEHCGDEDLPDTQRPFPTEA